MSDRGEDIKVTLGGEEYAVQRFRGLKAILVMASMTRIVQAVPDVMADATKKYYKRNTVTITESMSKLPRWEGFSKEDFDSAEVQTGVREIELPAPINAREQFVAALPALLEGARTEVIRLLAILVIPNQELKKADKSDTLYETLDKYEDLFLYEAELDEMVDLVVAAQDSIRQLNPKTKDRMGKTMRSMGETVYTALTGEPLPFTPAPQTEAVVETSTPPMSVDDVPTSSTPSPQPTDGTGILRSTEPLGVS